ncbi:glycosyltransferase [Roseibium marinum]|uniref:Glycosyltransferase involved in cell wall biosynthesis n=1 Tax=Roseibium marinum TaxID=281252 RepID=A0A2S3UTM1_9HYPH|nr:glycosyltransferase [Roseibium marinum]POF31077.1 glycosyltransferase involved in cell wall biosynthesis [Roseibium marinum]
MTAVSMPTQMPGDGIPLSKLRILYVQPATKSFAGIERVVDEICTELALKYGDTFEIDVLYLSRFDNYEVKDKPYNYIQMEIGGRWDLVRNLRSAIGSKPYDLVVIPQVEPTVIAWFACLGLGRKFAMHLHGNPRLEQSHLKAKILFFIMKTLVLNRLSGVFGTSPKQLETFKTLFPSDTPHFWTPNPVRRFDVDDVPIRRDKDVVTYVKVGRFAYQKGQDILIDAFSKLYELRKNVRLKIVGYGAGESEIKSQIARLGLQDVVSIEHHPSTPQVPLSKSDIYVSTSRWEGWSLAICEALRFGLPVVSIDCEFGPSDILVDQRLGRLVPLPGGDGLVDAMLYYCDNIETERAHSHYRKEFIDRFSSGEVVHVHAKALGAAALERPQISA